MTDDTDKRSALFAAAVQIAVIWKEVSAPVRFERVIFVNKIPVTVIVDGEAPEALLRRIFENDGTRDPERYIASGDDKGNDAVQMG